MALENIRRQLEKKSNCYQFFLRDCRIQACPFIPASRLNEARRTLADAFDRQPAPQNTRHLPAPIITPAQQTLSRLAWESQRSGNLNIANRLSRELYQELGMAPQKAYEIHPEAGAELMRCKYCLRHEMGRCTKGKDTRPWYLINQGYRLTVEFDCEKCEMVIRG